MPIQHTNKGSSVENDFDCRSKLMWQVINNLNISQTAQRNDDNNTTDDEDDRHMQSIKRTSE